MIVNGSTPWRHIGTVPYEIWRKRILDAGGVPAYAERAVWSVLGDDSALALGQLEAESSYASNFRKIPATSWNAWNLESNGAGLKFPSAVEGAKAWRARLYDPNYKGGVYARTQTISDLIYAYAPPKDPVTGVIWNDTEGYIRGLVAEIVRNGLVAPEIPVPTTTWQKQFDLMFGPGWRITQDWAAYGGPDLYEYGEGHGLDGSQHTGVDVGVPYGTPLFAPSDATVVCGGTGVGAGANQQGCDAFNDWGDGDAVRQGVGRIELLFPDGRSLIYGHSRTADVKPGDRVKRGQRIGTSGGMYGPHTHLEARRFANGDYTIIDPKALVASLPITTEDPKPMPTYIYGRVPMPSFVDREVAPENKYAGEVPAGSRVIRGFVRHTAYGYLRGTDTYFQQGNALTEYMIGNQSDGEASLDGQIRRFNNPASRYYPHASGPVDNPVGDAALFLQLWPGRINIDTVACERSGNGNTPVSDKERASRVALIAFHADQYGKYLKEKTGEDRFTCDTFPFIPSELNRSFMIDHGEVNADKRTSCPGPALGGAELTRETAEVAALMRRYQLGGVTPDPVPVPTPTPTPPVEIVPGVDFGVAKEMFGTQVAGANLVEKGGILSALYLKRAKAEGIFPALIKKKTFDTRSYFQFSNGWIALYNEKDGSIRWIEGA